MASAEQEIQFNTGNTLGALQIGTLISFTLFGVTTSQVYTYYSRFPEDAWHLKALVAFTWMCDLAHAICVATLLYTDDILDYRHPERFLLAPSKLFGVIILFSALITAAVQSFFSFRIYRISKRSAFPLFTASLTFLRTLAAIGLLYAINHVDSWAQFLARWDWLGTSLFCISAANDVIITMGMVFLLFRRRRKALNRTMAHLDRIITWTIETGLMTSVFTLLELAFFLTMQSNYIWIGLLVIGARLFSISLLASLNSRSTLRKMNEVNLTAWNSFAVQGGSQERNPVEEHTVDLNSHVLVERTTKVMVDP